MAMSSDHPQRTGPSADWPSGEHRRSSRRIRVALHSADLLSHTGLTRHCESCADVELLPDERFAEADVVVVAANRTGVDIVETLRRMQVAAPVLLITNEINEQLLISVL